MRQRLVLRSIALSVALSSCGGGSPPAQDAPAPSALPGAATPAAGVAAAPPAAAVAKGPDKAQVEQCFAAARASRARFSGEPAKATAKHLLIKYQGAKNADPKITRSKEEACLRAAEARDAVRNGADFVDIVKKYSEEAGAATRDGSIGAVERKDVAKPFADALFELSINQMSDVVETDFGFHVILRTQ